ncbi:hypothetical protein POVWA2_029780 [Plasmodium ovale wallikeri]|uniref:Uncharacterized protein n=1 Tax=Plasmodium ovale wallikeri TaxID=864142 RepID=A0A1A8YXN6_PLAOA|nr:hypothetical protein POVWA1_030170 [Plasmodium ovale wallikeri]SBT36368.1 hypothetical protein POVWA2_029780 [Plasmodium ovale wallikeri]
MSAKEKEIKVEEHKLICKYWEKQSECMSLLIKEWNKISEILESINVDPNNIINSLLSMYGEKAVSDFHLSLDEIKRSNIELDVNIEDISIPSVGEHSTNKFDPSGMTIMNLIQVKRGGRIITRMVVLIVEQGRDNAGLQRLAYPIILHVSPCT